MNKLILLILGLMAGVASAQTTAVTATITDSPDSQTWDNCQWSALVVSPDGPPTISGVPVARTSLTANGTCSASGVITATIARTSSFDQSNAYWQFSINPNASALGYVVTSATTGSSQNLSTALSVGANSPRFAGGTPATSYGYADGEVYTVPGVATSYYNTINNVVRQFNGFSWTGAGGTSGVASINGTPGAFTFSGSGVSCTTTTCTFSGGGAVTSVFARTGGVTAQTGDYTVSQVTGAAPLASPSFTGTVTLPLTGSTQCLHVNTSGTLSGTGSDCGSGGGSGTVTSFSAGTLSPLFTTSVATATTTPALTFTLSTAVANSVFGNFTGSTAAPTFSATPTFSAANLTSFPTFNQNTTGSAATLTTPRTIAGTSFNGSANIALANHFIVQGTTDSGLSGAQFLGALATGLVKNTTTTGVLSIGTSADVIADWTGSCSSSTFLRGDGACATATGSTGISGLTSGYIPLAGSATTITADAHIDDGVTTASTLTATESIAVNDGSGVTALLATEGTAPTAASGVDDLYALASTHRFVMNPNNAGALTVVGIATAGTSGNCVKLASNGIDIVDNGSACGSGGGGISFPQTVAGTTTSGGIPYFSGTTVLSSSGILNSNILVKGGGAGTAPTNSSITDNGSTVSTAEALTALTLTATGTTAGYLDLPQGTSNSAGTTSIRFQAPTSVTSQLRTLAGTPATGYSLWTNASGTMTETLVNAIPIANVGSAGLSGTSPVAITSAGAISCSTCVTSAASLTSGALMTGAGSQASQTVTTGTGVVTALGTNTGTAGAFGVLIASGTAVLNTAAVGSGACETVVTVSASGVATTDTITVGFNGDPTAVTGYGASATGAVLTIYPYPTSGNINVKVCNNTALSITPGALTLNFRVVR